MFEHGFDLQNLQDLQCVIVLVNSWKIVSTYNNYFLIKAIELISIRKKLVNDSPPAPD